MKISYNWLQSFFDKKLPSPEKLAEVLTMHSFEVENFEEIRNPKSEIRKDYVFDMDILPNRTHDCLCHLGVAREIKAILNLKLQAPNFKQIPISKIQNKLQIDIREPKLCRRYVGRIIGEIKVGPSPKWLTERLEAIGQRPINNIVDAANYVMFEMGQPLHTFDLDKVNGGIIVRRVKKGERVTTLDGNDYKLDKDALVIADYKKPIAIAGVKGGKETEVDNKTGNIILEAANFEPINIRRTSRKLVPPAGGLKTEASIRFENEISPELADKAMDRLTSLILEIAGGKAGPKFDVYPKRARTKKILLSLQNVSNLLGIEISEKEIIDILSRLGMSVKKNKGVLIIDVPFERLDLNLKEDLIEEIARIYGYNRIKSKMPEGTLIPPKRNDNYFYSEIVRDILAGLGFSEVYNYSFSERGEIEIQNPVSKDKKFLRTNLIEGLKKNTEFNKYHFKKIKIFEMGKIFPSGGETISLAGIITTTRTDLVATRSVLEEDFYEIKGVIEVLFQKLGLSEFYFEDSPNKIAEIKIGNTSVGEIDHNGWEINFEMLVKLANEEAEYRPISRYPAVMRDIAVYVPPQTRVTEVQDVIENSAGPLLIDTDLFDIFESENRKSFAFHLIFQSDKKTLTDREINEIMEKIFKAIEANPAWEIRK